MLHGERKTQKQIIAYFKKTKGLEGKTQKEEITYFKKTKGLELKTSTVSTWYNDANLKRFEEVKDSKVSAFDTRMINMQTLFNYDHGLYTKYHTRLPKIS